ncbi:MAG: fluoride efflux transporter FluC [Geodermatophilaceae bacterium]
MDTRSLPRNAAPEASTPARWPVLAVIAVGGALGAMGRHGIDVLLPAPDREFPLGTFLVNVVGCLLIGALAGALFRPGAHRLLRPFVAVGVLGGFTTFSTYAVQALTLALDEEVGTATGYLIVTAVSALLAVEAGLVLSRGLSHRRRRRSR